jgi:transcriptional enhancer factor
MSQEWEAVEQRGEVEGMKGDGTQQQQFVGGGYFQDMAQGEGQGHEEQYERFRSHKRRRTRLDDYNSCMEPPRMKMARSEVGDGAQ